MPHAERTIVIARPQMEVFAFFADGENDPRWRPAVKAMHRQGPLAVGARYSQLVVVSGRTVSADVEVTVFDPDERIGFRAVTGPAPLEGSFTFRGAEGGTEVTFTLHAELTGFKRVLMASRLQQAMDGEMSNLDKAKAILESGG
ncbi:MAG TPA: SRPBCC family protein [Trebonia sp.]|nr:SRPBCC family protein [Trebonia sp.]